MSRRWCLCPIVGFVSHRWDLCPACGVCVPQGVFVSHRSCLCPTVGFVSYSFSLEILVVKNVDEGHNTIDSQRSSWSL